MPRKPLPSETKTGDESDGKPKERKPSLIFRTCAAKCFACAECGYVIGPGCDGASRAGKWSYWRTT